MSTVEARTRNTGTRDPKRTPESYPFQLGFPAGAGVQRRRFFGEKPTSFGSVAVGVLVATGTVEAGVVAAMVFWEGNELTRRVVTVVGGECGGVASQEG